MTVILQHERVEKRSTNFITLSLANQTSVKLVKMSQQELFNKYTQNQPVEVLSTCSYLKCSRIKTGLLKQLFCSHSSTIETAIAIWEIIRNNRLKLRKSSQILSKSYFKKRIEKGRDLWCLKEVPTAPKHRVSFYAVFQLGTAYVRCDFLHVTPVVRIYK